MALRRLVGVGHQDSSRELEVRDCQSHVFP